MSRTLQTFPNRAGLTRRGFLGSTAAGVAAGGLIGLAPRRAAAQPKRGGTLRAAVAHGASTDSLDPGTYENGFTTPLSYGKNGFLTGIARDGSLEPELAESWEVTPDATTWRFKLRPGTTFHSGKPITPEDVVASINFHRGEGTTSAAAPLLTGVTDVAVDGDIVVVTLDAGNADFPATMADYHLAILPASGDTIDPKTTDGAGPYKLAEFQPGVSARFERFADDWNQERGWFDAVEMLAVIDVNARTNSLVSGDVDVADRPDLKTLALLARKPGLTVHSIPGNQHYTFAMNTTMDPYTDNNVRLAMKHAINREELVEKILFGYGYVGNDHPIGRGQRFFNDQLAQTTYDPEKAKDYLKQAGMESLSVELSAADAAFAGAVDSAVLYKNSAQAAGIDIAVNRVPNDGYWADVWMKAPLAAVYWSGRPVEDAMLTLAYSEGAAWNDTFWSNERFEELLAQARAELDEDKRREMYHEMQAILNQNGGAIIPMFANWVFVTSDKIDTGGEELASNWDIDGQRWMERWWFAE